MGGRGSWVRLSVVVWVCVAAWCAGALQAGPREGGYAGGQPRVKRPAVTGAGVRPGVAVPGAGSPVVRQAREQARLRQAGSASAGLKGAPALRGQLRGASQQQQRQGSRRGGFADAKDGDRARFYYPQGIALAPGGKAVLVADSWNHRVRSVAVAGGATTTLAGNAPGFADGVAAEAKFHYPHSVVAKGDLAFVSDHWNHRIRVMDVRSGAVTTLCGSGAAGFRDGARDYARFYYPAGLALTPDGETLFVADSWNSRVRAVITETGTVSTLAGGPQRGWKDGPAHVAEFTFPRGVSVSPDGKTVYVADTGNHRIRGIQLATGAVHTLAGDGQKGMVDADPMQSRFSRPSAVTPSPDGSLLYITDAGNRKLRSLPVRTAGEMAAIANGPVATVVSDSPQSTGKDGDGPMRAPFESPFDTVVGPGGKTLYVSDRDGHCVKSVTAETGAATELAGITAEASAPVIMEVTQQVRTRSYHSNAQYHGAPPVPSAYDSYAHATQPWEYGVNYGGQQLYATGNQAPSPVSAWQIGEGWRMLLEFAALCAVVYVLRDPGNRAWVQATAQRALAAGRAVGVAVLGRLGLLPYVEAVARVLFLLLRPFMPFLRLAAFKAWALWTVGLERAQAAWVDAKPRLAEFVAIVRAKAVELYANVAPFVDTHIRPHVVRVLVFTAPLRSRAAEVAGRLAAIAKAAALRAWAATKTGAEAAYQSASPRARAAYAAAHAWVAPRATAVSEWVRPRVRVAWGRISRVTRRAYALLFALVTGRSPVPRREASEYFVEPKITTVSTVFGERMALPPRAAAQLPVEAVSRLQERRATAGVAAAAQVLRELPRSETFEVEVDPITGTVVGPRVGPTASASAAQPPPPPPQSGGKLE